MEIQNREREVVEAWKNLKLRVERRREELGDASDLYRFLNMVRDLLQWINDIVREMKTQEKPRLVQVQ